MSKLSRPVLRYHGGKWKLAPWVLSFFPEHRIYVEPFGGGASLLMRKARSYGEVYNDLEGEIVNVFRVLQNPETAEQLRRLVELTPFARDEFKESYKPAKDPVKRAHNMIIRAYMGFGSASMTRQHATGFRSNANRSGTTPAQDWKNWPQQIPAFTERLQGIVIENKPAIDIMLQHDSKDTLHYVDPPYLWETRSSHRGNAKSRHSYKHEMSNDDHIELAEILNNLNGMVILSGYPCELYDIDLYSTWQRHERAHFADGARARTEVLWLNEHAAARLNSPQFQYDRDTFEEKFSEKS